MAKNFKKDQSSPMDSIIHKHLSNQDEFSTGGKTYLIKKWKNSEVFDRLPLVGNLFYVPLIAGIEDDGYEQTVDFGTIVGTLFHRLQEQDMIAFIEDMLSCVYLKGKEDKPVNIDEDFNTPVDICKALGEVLNSHFLFLHSADFQNLLQMGMNTANISTAISRP